MSEFIDTMLHSFAGWLIIAALAVFIVSAIANKGAKGKHRGDKS